MQPRPYQSAVIEAVESGFKTFDRQLVVLPTGGGKTIVFSHLAKRRLPGRTLILAHRDELIGQAIAKLHDATGIVAGKEKAESYASLESQVVVASVQSLLSSRIERWPRDYFSLVVADEAHHSISDSWQRVLQYFTAQNLGVTATPDRGDKRNLGEFYENIAAEVSLADLIRDGYLAPIAVKMLPLRIDINGVKQVAGDYDASALGDALVPYLRSIAEAIRDHATFRKVLCFVPLIHTSKLFVDTCREVGLSAEHIDGYDKDREAKLAAFKRGEFELLSNAMLLTEGYDEPTIDCVCCLRPTRSRALYSQMVGRGTRISHGKENLLLLDFLWSSARHSLSRPAHLIAKTEEEAEAITALAEEKQIGGGQGQLDITGLAGETAEARHETLRKRLDEHKNKKAKFIDAAAFALSLGDADCAEYEPTMHWESLPVTEPQAAALRRAKVDLDTVTGRGHASRLIGLIHKNSALTLATPAQRKMMKRRGCENWETATQSEARQFFKEMRTK